VGCVPVFFSQNSFFSFVFQARLLRFLTVVSLILFDHLFSVVSLLFASKPFFGPCSSHPINTLFRFIVAFLLNPSVCYVLLIFIFPIPLDAWLLSAFAPFVASLNFLVLRQFSGDVVFDVNSLIFICLFSSTPDFRGTI